jgi:hypothetical protein
VGLGFRVWVRVRSRVGVRVRVRVRVVGSESRQDCDFGVFAMFSCGCWNIFPMETRHLLFLLLVAGYISSLGFLEVLACFFGGFRRSIFVICCFQHISVARDVDTYP